MSKVFVGTWVDKKTRIDFKMKCAELELNQGDVIDLLIMKWLNKKHIKNGRE
tara:strand:+ start:903 stop:1058 length:156 start_codon:yes stop_codon:yes gene_type:complete